MSDPECVGGGVDVKYRPRRALIRTYLQGWRLLSRALGMVQGATQFCSKAAFEEIGGYDETAWIGEDVDFYWAMRKLAKRTKSSVSLIRNPRVLASSRRRGPPLGSQALAGLEDADLDQPSIHSTAAEKEMGLGRMVFASCPVSVSPPVAGRPAPAEARSWACPAGTRQPSTRLTGPPSRRRRYASRW